MKTIMNLATVLAVVGLIESGMGAPHFHPLQSKRDWSEHRFKRQTPAGKVIPVVVGGPQNLFVPNMIKAQVGDTIQFQFSNGNHTVTQSSETDGCQPLQQTQTSAIHSGHIPFKNGQTVVGTFNLPINSTDPMFFYCATGPHCQLGQVMVINPTSDDQLAKYVKVSMAAKQNIDGGQVSGGTVGSISLAEALFTPAPPKAAAPANLTTPGVTAPANADAPSVVIISRPGQSASITIPQTGELQAGAGASQSGSPRVIIISGQGQITEVGQNGGTVQTGQTGSTGRTGQTGQTGQADQSDDIDLLDEMDLAAETDLGGNAGRGGQRGQSGVAATSNSRQQSGSF